MLNSEPIFFNRDLSWIDFNARVLEEALRPDLPALERLKFLAIMSSNFDEFFMVRIASLKEAARKGGGRDPSGLTPEEQLRLAAERIRSVVHRQYVCLTEEVLPTLAASGLELVRYSFYSSAQNQYLESLFFREVYPNLTPLRVEDGRELPSIVNLSLHAAFLLEDRSKGNEHIAIVRIPPCLDRIVWLPSQGDGISRWTLLDDVIMVWGCELFPGYSVKETMVFKLTRDADFSVDEERDEDFLEAMEEVLVGRETSQPVRLSFSADSPRLRDELASRLGLSKDDLYEMPCPIDLRTLFELTGTKGFDQLREEVWQNYQPTDFPEDEPIWDRIKEKDRLILLPYQSFDPVNRMLQDAAVDPLVLSIKMTLYRTSGDSPLIKALERATRNGKHVTALVELKARFDEERNISWANRLEQAGVIVVYGLARLKVHAKVCLIVRRETEGVRRYVHLSTGNYNDRTAKLYGDVGFFSAQEHLASEVTLFFNTITGYSMVQPTRTLVMAPTNLKHRLIELIDREAKRSSQEYPGQILAKMNSLADVEVIQALYRASKAGVQISLNVRGICTLVPAKKGLSENIQVVSIIDRYLEHSRIFYFSNGGTEELYLSSADWMPRNLERRIELMFPVRQEDLRSELHEILKMYFLDNCRSRVLGSDGSWTLRHPEPGEETFRVQERLYQRVKERSEAVLLAPRQEFVVRRKPASERD